MIEPESSQFVANLRFAIVLCVSAIVRRSAGNFSVQNTNLHSSPTQNQKLKGKKPG